LGLYRPNSHKQRKIEGLSIIIAGPKAISNYSFILSQSPKGAKGHKIKSLCLCVSVSFSTNKQSYSEFASRILWLTSNKK